ncbi:MAG: hypothetical protein HFJ09_15360 [Lachnospiraceae bacterium]|nr:hypothetical protein [Lachnospiraceae bacterium]
MKRRVICTFMFTCLFLCGCGTKKDRKETVALPKRTEKAIVPTVSPKEDLEHSKIEEIEAVEYFDEDKEDYGANDYWCEVMKRQKEEIEEMVQWFKGIDYCKGLSFFSDGDIFPEPDNKKTIKKLQNEKGYKEMKRFIWKNEYDICNDWLEEKRITILHRFDDFYDMEKIEEEFDPKELKGNFCLVYAGSKLKKRESDYKKVDENYYSEVIFYE